MSFAIVNSKKAGAALALGLGLALATAASAQMEGVSGFVVDQKGYRLRNVLIVADGMYDTSDADGKFGTGRGPVVGVRGNLARASRQVSLAGSVLRFSGLGLGSTLKAELMLASGRRAGNTLSLSAAGGRADLDLNALAAGLPREGLYVLKADAGNGVEHHLLARLGNSIWSLSSSSVSAKAEGPLGKRAAPPATLRVSKPGYETQNVSVPNDGNVGVLTLKLDASSSVVDAPFDVAPLWYPTGWMGDNSAIKVTDETAVVRAADPDAKCQKWVYQVNVTDTAMDLGWSAVVWQYPSDNWGLKPGRRVTGAKKVTFWAKGEVGGERVDFKTGNDTFSTEPEPGMWKDTYAGAIYESLTTEWKKYEIPLDGSNTSMVISGFLWATTAAPEGAPVTFYIDEVRFE